MKNIIKIIITFSALFVTINLNAQCFNKISAGAIHSSAIKTNGTVWVWGWGGGQLGNSNDFDAYSPIALATGTTWQTVRSNVNNTFAIKQDGTLWGCGGNLYGGMGIGSTVTHISVPTQIGTASNWKEVAPGDSYSLALKTDNTIWGWGQNDNYQMGNSTCCANQLTPIQIGNATDWKSIGASNARCSFAIKNNGTLWGWGSNSSYMLGIDPNSRMTPTQHDTDTDWDKMSLGPNHIMAIKTNGTLWTWGGGIRRNRARPYFGL